MLRLASAVGQKATLARHPDLVDLLVAAGRDPITDRAAKAEFRTLISPFALLSPSGFRVAPACAPTSSARWPCPPWCSGASGTRSAASRSLGL